MIRKVMVPLDCSTFGEHAIPWALAIAGRAGASLELVNVLSYGSDAAAHLTDTGIEFYSDVFRRESQMYLDATLKRIQEISKVECTATLLDGDPAERLAHHAEETGSDLLVLTTHGRGAFGRFWLGSVADRLIRKSPVPLLLTRPDQDAVDLGKDRHVKHALVPLDGGLAAETILPHVQTLCKLWNAEMTLLEVVSPGMPRLGAFVGDPYAPALGPTEDEIKKLIEEQHQQAMTYLKGVGKKLPESDLSIHAKVIIDSSPGPAILEAVKSSDCDLIAMTTHGRRGLSRLFLGSVADKVIRGADIPILAYRPGS
jgi:nucleotide-binding universal stress UspA family protein